jgi:hypothetical protein
MGWRLGGRGEEIWNEVAMEHEIQFYVFWFTFGRCLKPPPASAVAASLEALDQALFFKLNIFAKSIFDIHIE